MFVTYFLIFLLAAIPLLEIAAIIPIGILGGLSAPLVMFLAFTGNLLTIALLIIFLDKFRNWRHKRKGDEGTTSTKKQQRARRIWNSYGLFGLTFIGPFFVGSHLSTFLAITFGGTKQRTFIFMTASLLTWTVLLGAASYYGFDFFLADEENLGFITRMLHIEKGGN